MCSFHQALILIEVPSREGSQTELQSTPSFHVMKPERSEKQEQLFRRLQDSLSSKITETMAKEETAEKKEERSRSVSPSSTISSSGEACGEYVVNPTESGEEDVRPEEESGQSSII